MLAPSQTRSSESLGKLYVVGTPIGNLEDITFRAVSTLKGVDLIACEDTRRTGRLLQRYSIRTPTVSYHEHNEMTRAPELVLQLEEGSHIALVSDAGMPGISDPGYRLVHLAVRHGIPVIPVPGVTAFVAALSAAGLPVDEFHFAGFLPRKSSPRRKALETLKRAGGTLIFYEAPHRVLEMLRDVLAVLGERPATVAREVTKTYEEFLRGGIGEVLARLKAKPVKGELTVLVGPDRSGTERARPEAQGSVREAIERAMAEEGLSERAALKAVARSLGISKSEAYRQWQFEKGLQK
ncbi:MAG: 16S rRNA (cytidine(1402)-2'-O)-methyltransferase [Acidobacteria bacterium]|nr:MAG: 16S rRNA (cytidine(1402)-2'-O)-methyltransferase [Acidobacteriota bacterium]